MPRSPSQRSPTNDARPETVIESLVHGLAVLDLFSNEVPVLGVGEIARHVGVHRSTASRLAATLNYCGFLSPAGPQGRYRLGPRLARLGELAAEDIELRRTALEGLQGLTAELGETTHMGLLDGTEVVTPVVVDAWHTVRMHTVPGKRSPAHCSSMGKAVLGELSDGQLDELYRGRSLERPTTTTIRSLTSLKKELRLSRERGYTIDEQELEVGLRCVGAPLFDHSGQVVGGISASGPAGRMQGQALQRSIDAVRASASSISIQLGCVPETSFWGTLPSDNHLKGQIPANGGA